MPGSVETPVSLDKWQDIVEVGWGRDLQFIAIRISCYGTVHREVGAWGEGDPNRHPTFGQAFGSTYVSRFTDTVSFSQEYSRMWGGYNGTETTDGEFSGVNWSTQWNNLGRPTITGMPEAVEENVAPWTYFGGGESYFFTNPADRGCTVWPHLHHLGLFGTGIGADHSHGYSYTGPHDGWMTPWWIPRRIVATDLGKMQTKELTSPITTVQVPTFQKFFRVGTTLERFAMNREMGGSPEYDRMYHPRRVQTHSTVVEPVTWVEMANHFMDFSGVTTTRKVQNVDRTFTAYGIELGNTGNLAEVYLLLKRTDL